jgi:BirA family transcriptional regulator, biotin operon repressor / biotin---[acetyl-CoA-carboxylase] ligase
LHVGIPFARPSNFAGDLRVSALGHPRLHLRVVGSTNDRARALALAGAPHGTLVTADAQTAGRGRQGRRWSAPPGSSLLMSLVLRADARHPADDSQGDPSRSQDRVRGALDRRFTTLPLAAAVAVCDVAGPEALVKWPNDIVLARQPRQVQARELGPPPGPSKVAGILVEGRPQQGWAVLGIGVNVAVRLEDLPAELRPAAATLGRTRPEIEPLLAELLEALERHLGDEPARTLDAWRERDALRGREIAWAGGHGTAEGIDDDGRLLVELADGTRIALAAGEVHLQGIG